MKRIDRIDAFLRKSRQPVCDCGTKGVLDREFDSYKCPRCCKWLESTCEDVTCTYCSDRPDYPENQHLKE